MLVTARSLLRGVADVIAPARCLSCLQEGTWLCQTCEQNLPRFPQRCIVCDSERPRGATCTSHKQATPLSGVISAGEYGWPHIQRAVQWLKFRGVTAVAPMSASLIAPALGLIAPLSSLQAEAVLIPIPLHPRRFRQRGFNQSGEIAASLSDQTGIPVADVLMRERATMSQTELPHEMREENMKEAFALKGDLPVKRYFLVLDDVTTTGSTLSTAASVFAKATMDRQVKAPQIWGVTVARG